MTTITHAIILGLIQGITEWLPVSSSGHLVLFQQLFGLGTPLIFDIMLHVATLFVILVVFWKEILNMAEAVIKWDFKSEYGRMAMFIVIGSIPTAIIGLVFHDFFIGLFTNMRAVGFALLLNGVILYSTKFAKGNKRLGFVDSLLVGTAQGIAIIPGISRSGITISTGLFRGVKRKTIAAFSFLLSVPAIVGAAILEGRGLAAEQLNYFSLGVGMVVTIVVGYFALRLLLRLVLRKKLHLFSYYCLLLGLLILILTPVVK